MSRVSIPVTTVSRSGATPPAQVDADQANGNQLDANDGRTIIEIVSSDAGAQTVAFELPSSLVDGQAVTPKTVTVPAGATRLVGPFPKGLYNDPSAVAADGTLTSDATAPANNDTVTIGARVYTFKTTLTGAANEVMIGASAAAALTNLKAAINAAAGAGSTYGTGTLAHADVLADTLTSTTLHVTARAAGPTANSEATTETSAHLSWGMVTLAGGRAANAALLIDPSVSTTLKFRAYSW